MSGDEFYDDDVTSGFFSIVDRVAAATGWERATNQFVDLFEFAWLIERGQPEGLTRAEWWSVTDPRTGAFGWMQDALRATRFSSKEEAEAVIARYNLPNHP